jgi:hypothetical protein
MKIYYSKKQQEEEKYREWIMIEINRSFFCFMTAFLNNSEQNLILTVIVLISTGVQ